MICHSDALLLSCESRGVNGTMERHTGACNSHCDAGRFQGPTDYAPRSERIQMSCRTQMVNHDRLLVRISLHRKEKKSLGGRGSFTMTLAWCHVHSAAGHGLETATASGFFGTLRLRCLGQVVIDEGECKRNCDAGVTLVREGLMMSYEALEHNAFSTEKPCPANQQYVGSIRFKCVDSLVSLHSGVCFKHCGNGQIQGATFNNLQHDSWTCCFQLLRTLLGCKAVIDRSIAWLSKEMLELRLHSPFICPLVHQRHLTCQGRL